MEWKLPLDDIYKIVCRGKNKYTSYIVRHKSNDVSIVCKEEPMFLIKEYYLTKCQAQHDYKHSFHEYANKQNK